VGEGLPPLSLAFEVVRRLTSGEVRAWCGFDLWRSLSSTRNKSLTNWRQFVTDS
jgi:hypothetical protein